MSLAAGARGDDIQRMTCRSAEVGRQHTVFSLGAERITRPFAGAVPTGVGVHKAGNDCDASEAGLQGEQARR
jgi:hypothetical protein